MAITYVNKSGMYYTNSSTLVAPPVGYAEGDLLILVMASGINYGSIASGWTILASNNIYTKGIYHRSYYKFASASESSCAVGVGGTATTVRARMFCFRGVHSTTPIGNVVDSDNINGALACSSVSSTLNGCVAFFTAAFRDNNTSNDTDSYSAWSFVNIGEATELCDSQYYYDSASFGIVSCMAFIPSAGASGILSATIVDATTTTAGNLYVLNPAESSADATVTVPLSTITDAQLEIPIVLSTRSVSVNIPLSTIITQIEIPSVSINGQISISVDVPILSEVSAELIIPRVFGAILNPIMTIDSLGNLTVRGIIKIGSTASLDMFGNLTVSEIILGDAFSLSANGKLTVKSITEGVV